MAEKELPIYTPENISWEKKTDVISSAQKFILPVPKFANGGEPLVYPKEHEKAGQQITDWEGKPIGDNGLVFFNYKDNSVQAAKGDGQDVIIFNLVSQEQANDLKTKIDTFGGDPMKLNLEQTKEVLDYAEKMGLGDRYNSDRKFIQEKMSGLSSEKYPQYGLHKRDDRDICHAVYIRGEGEFQGPAATPQKFDNGAVIVKQDKDVRLIQPEAFLKTYQHSNGQKFGSVDEIEKVGFKAKQQKQKELMPKRERTRKNSQRLR